MKRAIITGGSGLIGKALGLALSEDGWEVVNFDREKIEALRTLPCDVGDEASVQQAFATLGWDHLDLLINNAAYINDFEHTNLSHCALSEWEKVIRTNLTGNFLMTKTALPLLSLAQKGAVINLASTRAFMSEPGDFPYAASKGGIIALTQSLAVLLGPHIRVNAIAPGWITDEENLREVDHSQHPVGRVGRPKDIVAAVRYLIDAEFVTGEVMRVDGGMTKKMIYAH
jgi:NAD(P)-dependent dehydrogenase (short-subunit alcohol dehydrogenase family)